MRSSDIPPKEPKTEDKETEKIEGKSTSGGFNAGGG